MKAIKANYKEIISLALAEDLEPFGDLSCQVLDERSLAQAKITAKEEGILAGSFLIEEILREYALMLKLDPDLIKVELKLNDGDTFKVNDLITIINAPAKVLLGAERTILNFLQRLCGIASYTRRLSNLIKNFDCKLLDTRKTMPGLRVLEKKSFAIGGGVNHRFNLSEMVMLKENHLAVIADDFISYLKNLRQKLDKNPKTKNTKIEIEINQNNLDKLDLILEAKLPVDIVMLDNFAVNEAQGLVNKIKSSSTIAIELSGGINESNITDYAKLGADYISTGAVFTKTNNIDLSMVILDNRPSLS